MLVLLGGTVHADDNEVFLTTCSLLIDITTVDLCEGVDAPIVEERKDWSHLGSYDYVNGIIILRRGMWPTTHNRVLAHEMAHHILHVRGIVPFKPDNKILWCVSEVYSYEVTRLYAEAYNHTRSPGEINWIPRYPHCRGVL